MLSFVCVVVVHSLLKCDEAQKRAKERSGGTHLLKWMKSVVIDHPAPGKESPSSVNNEMMKNIYIYIYLKYFDDDDTSSIYNNNGCNCKNVFFFHGNLAYRGCDVEMSGIFFFYLFFLVKILLFLKIK